MPHTVYVVNVHDRLDGLYVFGWRSEAEAFERAVVESGGTCELTDEPLNTGALVRALIEAERDQ